MLDYDLTISGYVLSIPDYNSGNLDHFSNPHLPGGVAATSTSVSAIITRISFDHHALPPSCHHLATILPPSSTATISHTTQSPKSSSNISRFCFESVSYNCMYLTPCTNVMNPKSVERPNMRTERCFVDEKLGENYSYLQKRRLLTKTDLSTDFAKVLSLSQQPTSKIEVVQKGCHTFSISCKS